jgi:hypothetical protein
VYTSTCLSALLISMLYMTVANWRWTRPSATGLELAHPEVQSSRECAVREHYITISADFDRNLLHEVEA